MTYRTPIIIVFVVLASANCFGQRSFKGLTPGKSTRADVERVLGRPVRRVSETLIGYRPQPLTSAVFVQYGKDSPVIERIELFCWLENSTCADLIKNLSLPLQLDDAEKVKRQDDKWLAYYGPPLLVVTTGEMTSRTPVRVAFYSPGLYEATVAEVEDARDAVLTELAKLDAQPTKPAPVTEDLLNDKAISLPQPTYPAMARSAHVSGTVIVQVTIDEEGNVVAARAVSGHPLLREAAVAAARQAKFPPTKLSGEPGKVSGVLTYTFEF